MGAMATPMFIGPIAIPPIGGSAAKATVGAQRRTHAAVVAAVMKRMTATPVAASSVTVRWRRFRRRVKPWLDAERPVGGAHEAVDDARLGGRVAGVPDHLEVRLRPGVLQRPGALHRRHHVEAALHDPARDVLDLVDVLENPAVF